MDLQTCLKAALRSKYESLVEAFSKSSILPSRLCYQDVRYNYIEPDFFQHEYRSLDRSFFFPDAPLADVLSCKCQHKNRNRTVITLGVSGVGKTTMVQSCALDWAKDKGYHNISFLFPLTFWELNLLKDRLSLIELLQTFYPELKELDASVLNEDGVWFILDGLDEFQIQLNFGCPAVSDVSEASTVDSFVTNLIRGNLLPRAHIWVTSRISAESRIPPFYLLKKTELRGFSDEQKEQHFRMVIGDSDLANKAINHVKISRSLDSLCQIPPICTIMASALKDHVKGQKGFKMHPLSLTEIYNLGFGALEAKHLPIFTKLKKVALLRMGVRNVMYEDDLSGNGISVEEALAFAETCPLVLRTETGLNGTTVFRFGHLSVQEFLAASQKLEDIKTHKINLSSYIQDLVDKVLANNKGVSDLLLRFMFGLIKEHMLLLPNDLLFGYVKEKILSKISSYSTVILFHCLREYDSQALQEEVRFFQRYGNSQIPGFSLMHWRELMQRIRAFEGIRETFEMEVSVRSDEKLIKNIPAIFKSRKAMLKFSNLTDKSCPALAAVLSSKESFLRELDLGYNSFSTSGVQELAEGLNSLNCRLKILRLQGCGLTAETCQYLSQCLIQHKLQELDLSSNGIGDQGLKLLSCGLGSSSCRLQTLKLSQCDIEEAGCYHLGSALDKDPACLSVLDLSINMIGDRGANEIFKNFDISRLKKLELYYCDLTVLSCESIGEALKCETSTLLELNLSNNSLKDAGFKIICEGMYAWCSLQKLNVSRCGITAAGCRYLAKVLCSISQLTNGWMGIGEWQAVELIDLDLSMNHIGDKGVKEISPGLMNPLSHLKTLNLSYCSLTDSCCAELASGLMSKVNILSELDLSHNNLQDKGVKKLCIGLQSLQCKLEKLSLRTCGLTSRSVQFLTSALKLNPFYLTELHLMGNRLEDSEIRALMELTKNQKYALRTIDVSLD
ncbi:NACHT, LRR and PYD domains-containing protein 14 [Oreochromis niloticus]|uniref:NACHT, LRR and PYD domains-containing protein 14 n=1 Tax=Oreochromis niloticus TaxID=8128 RepID=A0A669DUM1_ORENI|nr:NACHT, LRR and PYD domains-containing protein 14 [Oreochromis niloticus]